MAKVWVDGLASTYVAMKKGKGHGFVENVVDCGYVCVKPDAAMGE